MKPLLGAPLLIVSGLVLAVGVGALLRWRVRAWLRILGGFALVLPGLAGGTVGGYWFWFTHRSQPEPVREEWFTGVRYERLVLQQPRPVVAHLVRIDLEAPGIDFVVTPAQPSGAGDVFADKTSGFAARHGVQVAINANYFYPFHNTHPLDYEPHVGQPVHVVGTAASAGRVYGNSNERMVTLYLSRDRRVSFERPSGEVWHAISGLGYVVRDGASVALEEDGFSRIPYARMLAAVDGTGRSLLLLTVDGKQLAYSEGLTLEEAAQLLVKQGAHTGIQLDGGGSATLVRQDARGRIRLVNTPTNFRIAGWERVVATHLGVSARPL
ncbi:phosphodiester glycosidase family protein [Hyalangium sp.]|uniref:phosphodiester glycosidase family protein n=1 Tax=Hyalangium sp. TaxID=2028555 RepID=UPI002D2B7F4B|nr:phosphodiester glycosidase family protein [Hyalangium sp.]HYI03081.1 phosphodiester glycosidase family protein [Hyalangium sp.]